MRKNNKTIMMIIIVMGILLVVAIAGILITTISKSKNASGKIIVDAPNTSEEELKAKEEQKLNDFNSKFTSYISEEVSGTLIKSLLSEVILSNNQNEERQLVVKIEDTEIENGTEDTEKIASAQKTISNEYIYMVECNYEEETGYVSEIVIKKGTTANVDPEIQKFNQNFEQYKEQIVKGATIKGDIANLIKASNRENDDHKIVMYSGEVKSINELKDEADYKIILSYDETGYVYRIDAEEQT